MPLGKISSHHVDLLVAGQALVVVGLQHGLLARPVLLVPLLLLVADLLLVELFVLELDDTVNDLNFFLKLRLVVLIVVFNLSFGIRIDRVVFGLRMSDIID